MVAGRSGTVGKVLGPIGGLSHLDAVAPATFVLSLTNDGIWWLPFRFTCTTPGLFGNAGFTDSCATNLT
jgi:hypothetical protein